MLQRLLTILGIIKEKNSSFKNKLNDSFLATPAEQDEEKLVNDSFLPSVRVSG